MRFSQRWISRQGSTTRRLILIGFTLLVLVASLWAIPTPYYVTAPGAAIDTNRLVFVSKGEHHDGHLFMLIVVTQPANLFWYLYAKFDPRMVLETRQEFLGDIQDYAHYVELTRKMMSDSQKTAQAMALQALGYGRGVWATGVRVMDLVAGAPANGHLEKGDVLTEVDGVAVRTAIDLREALQSVAPGRIVSVKLKRGSQELTLAVPTGEHPERRGTASFGLFISDELSFDLPVPITVKSGSITGPSAGLMFTLQMIDQLSPGGITGQLIVAGTGTIEPDGSVGKIGGVQQKVYTAEAAGADVMFVPQENYEDARQVATRIRLVPVAHLRDALDWLRTHRDPAATAPLRG